MRGCTALVGTEHALQAHLSHVTHMRGTDFFDYKVGVGGSRKETICFPAFSAERKVRAKLSNPLLR